jgi:hypothetical protein
VTVKVQTKGVENVVKRMITAARAARDTDAGLEAQNTSGTAYGRKQITEAQTPTLTALTRSAERAEGKRHVRRSAGQNVKIWRRQQREGRNAFTYDKSKGRRKWVKGIRRAVRHRPDAIHDAGEDVADFMLDSVQRNIDMGKNIAPNKGRYAEWKRKRFPSKPALELSGQLRKGLKPKVLQRGRR